MIKNPFSLLKMYQNDTHVSKNVPKKCFLTENMPLFVNSFCYDKGMGQALICFPAMTKNGGSFMNEIARKEAECWIKFPSLLKTRMNEKQAAFQRVKMIPLSLIDLDPFTSRKTYDEVATVSLADSIRRHGLLQPIIVMKNRCSFFEKLRYTCLVGARRLKACQMLSLARVPCFVISSRLVDSKVLSLVENLQRDDLSMFESADSFLLSCMNRCLSATELAESLSVSRKIVADLIPFSAVENDERITILENSLSEQQVKCLMRIENTILRRKILTYVVERGFGEKQTEEYVDSLLRSDETEMAGFENAFVTEFVNNLSYHVSLVQKKGIAVHFEEFEHRDEVQYLIRVPKA